MKRIFFAVLFSLTIFFSPLLHSQVFVEVTRDTPKDLYLIGGADFVMAEEYFLNTYFAASFHSFHPLVINADWDFFRFSILGDERGGPWSTAGPESSFYSALQAGAEWCFLTENEMIGVPISISETTYFTEDTNRQIDYSVRAGYAHYRGPLFNPLEIKDEDPYSARSLKCFANADNHGFYLGLAHTFRDHLSVSYTRGHLGGSISEGRGTLFKQNLDIIYYPLTKLESEGYLEMELPFQLEYNIRYTHFMETWGLSLEGALGVGPVVSGSDGWRVDSESYGLPENLFFYISFGMGIAMAGL